MVDVDQYARRAVAAPVAAPPQLDAITRRARRRRDRKRGRLIATVLVIVLASGAAIALVARDDARPARVAAPGTRPARDRVALTTAQLVRRLAATGKRITRTGAASGYPIAETAQLLCVDETQVRVYEFETRSARVVASEGISRDGSSLSSPDGTLERRTIIEWIGPPHFFARGRIIALVLQDNEPLLDTLTNIMGPTISPDVAPAPSASAPCR